MFKNNMIVGLLEISVHVVHYYFICFGSNTRPLPLPLFSDEALDPTMVILHSSITCPIAFVQQRCECTLHSSLSKFYSNSAYRCSVFVVVEVILDRCPSFLFQMRHWILCTATLHSSIACRIAFVQQRCECTLH